jgi:TolB protein
MQKWMSEKYCCPLFSPDGHYLLAEGVVPPRNSEIFLLTAEGSEVCNLTQHPADDGAPAWSPDGRTIIFKSDRDGGKYAYFRMNLDGSGVTKIVSNVSLFSRMDWSPDGKYILYETKEGIAVSSSDGSQQQVLASKASQPAWSPDGKWILYWVWESDEMRIVSLDRSQDLKIANGPASTWTPDGKSILFVSPWEGSNKPRHVYRIDSDGKNPIMILENVQISSINNPRQLWNPAGDRIALAVEPSIVGRLNNGIVILDSVGKIVHDFRKADKFLYGGSLSWSPDGKTVAFDKFYITSPGELKPPGYPGGLYLLKVDSSEVKQLIANKEISIDPRHPPW